MEMIPEIRPITSEASAPDMVLFAGASWKEIWIRSGGMEKKDREFSLRSGIFANSNRIDLFGVAFGGQAPRRSTPQCGGRVTEGENHPVYDSIVHSPS